MKKLFLIVGILVLADLVFMAFDAKALIAESLLEPEGNEQQRHFECMYFNGRGVVERSYWYSSNNMLGRDACPFLITD